MSKNTSTRWWLYLFPALILSIGTALPAATDLNQTPSPSDLQTTAPQAKKPVSKKHDHYWLGYFDLGSIGAVPGTGGGYVISPWLSWNPILPIASFLRLRGQVGFTLFKNNNPISSTFTVIDFEGLLSFPVDGGYFELGGGVQNWSGGNGGMKPILSMAIVAPFPKDYYLVFDNFFMGYSAFLSSPQTTNEVRVGVGVAF